MAEDLRLNIVTDADSKGLQQAAKDLSATKVEAEKLGDSLEGASKNTESFEQSMDSATRSVRSHQQQMELMRAEYKKTTAEVTRLNAELLNTNTSDKSGLRKRLREQESYLRELKKIAREFQSTSGIQFSLGGGGGATTGAGALAGLGRGVGGIPTSAIIGASAATAAVGPPLVSMAGGAIAGGIGTAAMAAGILSAAKSPEVRSAAQKFGADISAEFFSDQTFVKPVVNSLGILKDAFQDFDLAGVLAPLAPTVEIIAGGLADFAEELKPGLSATLERMAPFAEAAAEGMGDLGEAFGFFMDEVSGSEGALDGLRLLFQGIGGTMRFLGVSIRFVEDRFHELSFMAQSFSQIAADINPDWMGFDTLNKGLGNMLGKPTELSGEMNFMSSSAGQAAQKAFELSHGLEAVETEAFNAIDALQQYDDQLAGRANGQIAFEQSLDDLAAGFKEFGRNLNIDTQIGRDNMKNFEGAIKDAQKVRDDLVAQGKIEEANAAYKRMTDRIREVMKQAGFTKAEIDKMVAPRELTIGITYKERNRPTFITSSLSEPARDAAGAGRRASGGPVFPNQDYWVGEEGPELLRMGGQGGFVYPNRSSSGGGGGGMANVRPLNINFPAGSYEAHLIETISTAVQARGGRLAVLGLKAA